MKKDKNKTKVRFYREDDTVLAIFPEVPFGGGNNNDLTCYAHVGQHSACTQGYISSLSLASMSEYKSLKEELEGLGYNLEIQNPT
jgi:hypothetical protein